MHLYCILSLLLLGLLTSDSKVAKSSTPLSFFPPPPLGIISHHALLRLVPRRPLLQLRPPCQDMEVDDDDEDNRSVATSVQSKVEAWSVVIQEVCTCKMCGSKNSDKSCPAASLLAETSSKSICQVRSQYSTTQYDSMSLYVRRALSNDANQCIAESPLLGLSPVASPLCAPECTFELSLALCLPGNVARYALAEQCVSQSFGGYVPDMSKLFRLGVLELHGPILAICRRLWLCVRSSFSPSAASHGQLPTCSFCGQRQEVCRRDAQPMLRS